MVNPLISDIEELTPGRKRRTRKLKHSVDKGQPLRIIGYIRVSTVHQAKSGISLSAQRKKLKAYATAMDYDLVEIIEDDSESAKSLRRPGLLNALSRLESHEVDGLMVVKLDRLSRNVKDLDTLINRYFINGWHLLSVQENIDTATAAGRMVLNVLMSVSQWEREAIGERVRDSHAEKRARGEKIGCLQYGYRVGRDGKKLIPVKKEQTTIKMARRLRSSGRSYQSIADRLTERGRLQRNGKPFHATQVQRMLK